jgi:hypothetical protein
MTGQFVNSLVLGTYWPQFKRATTFFSQSICYNFLPQICRARHELEQKLGRWLEK